MKCIILNVYTETMWKNKPISNVILTAAKFDRDRNRNGLTKTLKQALKMLQRDFNKVKMEFFKGKDEVGQQEYVDFVNSFLKERRMEAETSEERMARRLAV